ncbi:DUF2867 domain-containing protein [Formosa haliotis]|uniref:DUF2867 domain-containing protein n=1 Tax=Formosa haliotis TaxID=1555194 RepID=UPI0008258277|nr:DUF2867 domain-containing protein [Formosa haliotis]
MKTSRTNLPSSSLLNVYNKEYKHIDSFQGVIHDKENKFTATDMGMAFFSSGPKWVEYLFALRNKIVSIFGLKTSDPIKNRTEQLENFNCDVGAQLGLFKVLAKTENEIILGEDDKHLNFRVSLFLHLQVEDTTTKAFIISTLVAFNNRLGKLYFLIVNPFHKLIIPIMLKGIIKELEKQN